MLGTGQVTVLSFCPAGTIKATKAVHRHPHPYITASLSPAQKGTWSIDTITSNLRCLQPSPSREGEPQDHIKHLRTPACPQDLAGICTDHRGVVVTVRAPRQRQYQNRKQYETFSTTAGILAGYELLARLVKSIEI